MMKNRITPVTVIFCLMIMTMLGVSQALGQRLLPPPGETANEANSPALADFGPYQIVVFDPDSQQTTSSWASAESIASRVGAIRVSDWTAVEELDSISPISALIVNASAVSAVNQDWLKDAYWNRGLIVASVNLDGPEMSDLIGPGRCDTNRVADNWRPNDFYIIKSQMVLAAIESEQAAQIRYNRETCGAENGTTEPIATGYLTQSKRSYVSPLTTEADLHVFARFLLNGLLSVDRKRVGFAQGEYGQALTPENFRQRMAAIGMSSESIERAIAEIQ